MKGELEVGSRVEVGPQLDRIGRPPLGQHRLEYKVKNIFVTVCNARRVRGVARRMEVSGSRCPRTKGHLQAGKQERGLVEIAVEVEIANSRMDSCLSLGGRGHSAGATEQDFFGVASPFILGLGDYR